MSRGATIALWVAVLVAVIGGGAALAWFLAQRPAQSGTSLTDTGVVSAPVNSSSLSDVIVPPAPAAGNNPVANPGTPTATPQPTPVAQPEPTPTQSTVVANQTTTTTAAQERDRAAAAAAATTTATPTVATSTAALPATTPNTGIEDGLALAISGLTAAGVVGATWAFRRRRRS